MSFFFFFFFFNDPATTEIYTLSLHDALPIFAGNGAGSIREARIALTAVAPTIVRAPVAEALLVGRPPDGAGFRAAGEAAAQSASPIDDVRASAGYREAMIRVVVARALAAAARRAAGEPIPIPASRWAHGQQV